MTVNKERVALGIAALRSGQYKRGAGKLHQVIGDGTSYWCCLGVFTDVAISHGLEVSRAMTHDRSEQFGDQENEYFCEEAREWFGFEDADPLLRGDQENDAGVEASDWNDIGGPYEHEPREDFTDIADAFERTYIRSDD